MIVYPNLKKPEPGQPLKVSWGNSVVDAIKSITPIAGKNVRLTRTSNGTVINIDVDELKKSVTGDGGAYAIPCRVTGGSALHGYDVTVYGDGLLFPPTGNGTLMAMQFNTETTLPIGTVVMGYPSKNMVIGGTEQD